MKTKNLYRTGITTLALALTLAACTNIFRPGTDPGETAPDGMGLARISLNGDGERTAVPGIGGLYFTLDFTAPGKSAENRTLDSGVGLTLTVALEPAVWALEVQGYANSNHTDLKVRGNVNIPITAGTSSSFDVYLIPDFGSGDTGSLAYSISFPASIRARFGLYPIDNTPGISREINISPDAGGTASNTLSNLAEGSYRAVINLYDGTANTAAAWTGVAHISGGATTSLTHTFTAADFAAYDPLVTTGTNTLSAKLNAALASSSGAYTIALGSETDLSSFSPKTLNVTGNKDITVTIRGNGKTVQLGSNGSLFTLGAASGSSLKLVLQDVTLQGRSSNTASLVRVNSGGTLEMKAGSFITGNTDTGAANVYNYPYGGGVYVENGTFIMSGGAVSGNSADSSSHPSHANSFGGGVYVENGTFTMNGGTVSSNSAIASSPERNSSAYGGGVYVENGTFTMSGGTVRGNSVTAPYVSEGGGVYVSSNVTFTMSGGAVSGNSITATDIGMAYARGGGVYVLSPFTMSGGTVSGNSANSALNGEGGGAFVWGDFTMSGGMVSGNSITVTATTGYVHAHGGGVYALSPFTMSGGMVSGNSVSASVSSSSSRAYANGGGVYVYESFAFTMSGGAVSGNSVSASVFSSSSRAYANGGGVYAEILTKQPGAVIYGSNEGDSALKNIAGNNGDAVYIIGSSTKDPKIRSITAGMGITLDSSLDGSAGGWEESSGSDISDITYSSVSGSVWTWEPDGMRESPSISNNDVTKARVNFTSVVPDTSITIALDVSSQSGYDFAFISTLDNGSATYNSGYYPGSRISGTTSVTVTIPVPMPGSHFVDICYRKDSSGSSGVDHAWFKVIE